MPNADEHFAQSGGGVGLRFATFDTFFRLASPGAIVCLRELLPESPEQPGRRTTSTELRELRNRW